jgi:hypothetical protein
MTLRNLWVVAAAGMLVAARHPTPSVVLVKQSDVIRTTLEDCKKFFVRKVTIGKDDLAKIRQDVDYSPENPDVSFYLGRNDAGKLQGVVLFPQVNTAHGPLEVGLTLKRDGTIASAIVTKATVETKPWVEQMVSAGLLRRFQGLKYDDDVATALKQFPAAQVGQMPSWVAQVIASAVRQGLVLHHVLFTEE